MRGYATVTLEPNSAGVYVFRSKRTTLCQAALKHLQAETLEERLKHRILTSPKRRK